MLEPNLGGEDIEKLRQLLEGAHGVDLSYYTESFLTRRVASRMRQAGCGTTEAYIGRLRTDEIELRSLLSSLTINVTEFFRDPEVYEVLRRDVLPRLLKDRKRVIVWSSGCATGQEPYSLAMLLDECVAKVPGSSYVIYASDISPAQLDAARAGVYPIDSLKGVPSRFATKYFAPQGPGLTAVVPALKENIRFFQHDLSSLQPTPVAGFDLVLCRNVIIYFSTEAKAKLLEMFQRVMSAEAFLVLGGAETILNDRYFRVVDPKYKVYRAMSRN